MANLRQLQRTPSRAALKRLCAIVLPGGSVERAERLRGGTEAGMHAVTLRAPSGERLRWVIRRYPSQRLQADPEHPLQEWSVLQTLAAADVPAPRPVYFDPEGAILGHPAIIMIRLPGRGELAPRDLDGWLRQLGITLAAIHRRPGPATLPSMKAKLRWLHDRLLSDAVTTYARCAEVRAAVERWLPHVRIRSEPLVHGDFWPGNTLWLRGRLTGVVDWTYAFRGEPAFDVASCRVDLTLLFGASAADAFTNAYRAATHDRLADQPFWDLVNSLRWMPDVAADLPSYHDLGRDDVTAEGMRERFDRFVADALAGGTESRGCHRSGPTRRGDMLPPR